MASKNMSLWDIKISKLLTPTVVVIVLVVVVRWMTRPPQPLGAVMEVVGEKEHLFEVLDDSEIQAYLAAMKDTRPESCKHAEYEKYDDTVSIILDFHEHQFYNLKMTLESIVKFTPDHLYHEIVLLDDGSANEVVRQDAYTYLQQPKFKKIRGFRSDNADGQALTRFKASKVATGSILVFLHSLTTVNENWLPPLVDMIRSDRHAIAVPHFDSVLTGYRFFPIQDNLINVFTWTMDTVHMETTQTGTYLTTPVMTGEAFAVDKEFLDSIGNFDEGFVHGGGEALELSLRTWMCGGSIKIVTCSRVAGKDALEVEKIGAARNFRRIVELWLDSSKPLAYKQKGISADMDEAEIHSFRTRTMYLKKQVSCKSFSEFLKKTVPHMQIPPSDARFFGKLRSETGRCVKVNVQSTTQPEMAYCKPHMYETDTLLTFDTRGRIKSIDDQCLDLIENTVQFTKCDSRRKEQLWILTGDKLFKSTVKNEMCLQHKVGEMSKHFLTVSTCVADERTFTWQFVSF